MIVQSTYPNDSRVKREAEILSEENYKVHIVCLKGENQQKYEIFYDNIFVYRIQNIAKDEGILKYIIYSLIFFFRSFFYSIKLSKKNDFSLVQVHNLPDYLVFATIYFKIKGTPIILDLHDLTPELFKSKWGNKHKILQFLTRITEKKACDFANHIITTSKGFKEQLTKRKIKADKISIILNNPAKFIKRSKPLNLNNRLGKVRLVYHGTIAHRFGLHIVINALPIILSKFPNTIFHIYGGGDSEYKDYLEKTIDKLKLKDFVDIKNSLIHEEIIDKIQEYDIGVVPYLEDDFMQLALSTKSFEYAKLYIPMIVSDLRPMREYFDDDSVIFFKAGDSDDFANKLIRLINDEKLVEKITLNAFKKVQTLTDGSNESNYKNLIKKIITDSKRISE